MIDLVDSLTISRLVEISDRIIAGQVTGVLLSTSTRGSWDIRIAVRETLSGTPPENDVPLQALSMQPLDLGFTGTFFLSYASGSAVGDSFVEAGHDDSQLVLLGGRDCVLPDFAPDALEVREHLQRLIDGEGVESAALRGLMARSDRLRVDAAADLGRYQWAGGVVEPANIEAILSALQDSTFPDAGRAMLTRVLAGLEIERSHFSMILIDLLEANIGDPGFQIEAARLLSREPAAEAFGVASKLVRSRHHLVRAQALTALEAIGSEEALALMLRICREHPNQSTREVAQQITQRITGEDS